MYHTPLSCDCQIDSGSGTSSGAYFKKNEGLSNHRLLREIKPQRLYELTFDSILSRSQDLPVKQNLKVLNLYIYYVFVLQYYFYLNDPSNLNSSEGNTMEYEVLYKWLGYLVVDILEQTWLQRLAVCYCASQICMSK